MCASAIGRDRENLKTQLSSIKRTDGSSLHHLGDCIQKNVEKLRLDKTGPYDIEVPRKVYRCWVPGRFECVRSFLSAGDMPCSFKSANKSRKTREESNVPVYSSGKLVCIPVLSV